MSGSSTPFCLRCSLVYDPYDVQANVCHAMHNALHDTMPMCHIASLVSPHMCASVPRPVPACLPLCVQLCFALQVLDGDGLFGLAFANQADDNLTTPPACMHNNSLRRGKGSRMWGYTPTHTAASSHEVSMSTSAAPPWPAPPWPPGGRGPAVGRTKAGAKKLSRFISSRSAGADC